MKYYSQIGQDKFIDDLFKGKYRGYFLDIGSNDGITGNNTYFFEKYRNWTGVCIEPNPDVFEKLKQNGRKIVLNAAIFNDDRQSVNFQCLSGYTEMLSGIVECFDQTHKDRIERELKMYGGTSNIIEVKCCRLSKLTDKLNIHHVDYCSIDVEGAEMSVLQSIDFDNTYIHCFSVENNNGTDEVRNFMKTKGYSCTKLEFDDIFVKEEVI